MTTELFYLALTAGLAASLWIPYIVGVNIHLVNAAADFVRPPDLKQFLPWVHRAHRAHLNVTETALPFAALVLIANAAGVSSGITVGTAIAVFWLRVVHAVGMISGKARFPVRPVIFTASWLSSVLLVMEIIRLG